MGQERGSRHNRKKGRSSQRKRISSSLRRRQLQLKIRIAVTAVVIVAAAFILVNFVKAGREDRQEIKISTANQKGMDKTTAQTVFVEEAQMTNTPTPVPTETVKPGTSVEICMVGDVLIHENVYESCQSESGYDFNALFSNVSSKVQEADLAIVNQETVLGGAAYECSGWPSFNSPCEVGDAIYNAGFDVVLQGTNHAMDIGGAGVESTLNYWRTNHPDIGVLGIHTPDITEQQPYIYEKNGFRIAILNYTYGTNSEEENAGSYVYMLNEETIAADIQRARGQADFVIVCPHWGTENVLDISSDQRYWTEIFQNAGADLVIGTHPHVIQPVEMRTDVNGHSMLVYYSLGNFVSDQEERINMIGAMAYVVVRKDDQGVHFDSYEALPLITHETIEPQSFTTYFASDYSEDMAASNGVQLTDYPMTMDYYWEVWNSIYTASADLASADITG